MPLLSCPDPSSSGRWSSNHALAGVRIKEMLGQRDYRHVMVACIREGLEALKAAGIKPVIDAPLPARMVPWILV